MTFTKLLKGFIFEECGLFFSYLFFSALLAISGLYLPWLVKVFIESLETNEFMNLDKTIYIKIFLCIVLVYYATKKMLISIGDFVETNIYKFRISLLKKIIYAPFHEAKKNNFSSLTHHMIQDISGIEKNLITCLNYFVFHIFIVIGVFSIMLSINLILFISVMMFFITSIFMINFLGKNLELTGFSSQKALLKTFAKIQDILKGLQTIKIYGAEQRQFQKIDKLNRDYYSKIVEFIKKEAIIHPFDYLLEVAGICLVLFVGGILVQKKQISIAYLFSFILYIELLGEPASYLSDYIISYKNIKIFLNRLEGLFKNIETMQPSYFSANQKVNAIKKISIQNLSFHYPQMNRYVLKDINLEVKKGDIIGICGKNGSGKTTLVELLLGFLKPISGKILVNNTDLYSLDEQDWRGKITLMPQKSYFFEDTLRNNLTLLNSEIDEQNLKSLINLVDADHIIANLPKGLDTVLANHRVGLSGGELQKLSLVRVLLLNPEVIILDEPFNHLDTESSKKLKEVILKISKDKIIFIIEHHHEIVDEILTHTILLKSSRNK
jgi:ABC-type multidrug transport system fused ATPase/permease subunit